MATKYKNWLAGKVLGDHESVSYTALSRGLKVHCDHAKRMLYEFHRSENAKKPESVNATYLITGIRRSSQPDATSRNHLKDGEDDVMQSSPTGGKDNRPEFGSQKAPITSIILVREQDLADVRAQFEIIHSIFIYSVQETCPPDVHVLADFAQYVSNPPIEDFIKHGAQYGMIQNKNVERRSDITMPGHSTAVDSISKPTAQEKAPVKIMEGTQKQKLHQQAPLVFKTEKAETPTGISKQSSNSQRSAKSAQKPAAFKRETSDIFKAFAKAKPKEQPKDDQPSGTSGISSAAQSQPEDSILDDESEEERTDLFLDTGARRSTSKGESKEAREKKLRDMMEDDDMPDAPEIMEEKLLPQPEEIEPPVSENEDQITSEVTPSGTRRRRGKRKVMKKRMTRDAEGYLVTNEEPVWESFSEDEPEPPAKRKAPASTTSTAGKISKGGNKSSQGNIMSFFGRIQSASNRPPSTLVMMKTTALRLALLGALVYENTSASKWDYDPWTDRSQPEEQIFARAACPDYVEYSQLLHPPYSEGPLKLSFQRPVQECRTFSSPLVEKVIRDVTSRMVDKDLARIFENAFPNTLDTTVRWHVNGTVKDKLATKHTKDSAVWEGAQSFIVTGDINAEWLRDSTNQLAQYQKLANGDVRIKNLILGAINTQTEFVIQSPYCNAFQPPPPSGLRPTDNGQPDTVHPVYEPSVVFECKYELDSIANFLSLGNQFHASTKSAEFLTKRWYKALDTILRVLDEQSQPTFNENGQAVRNQYTFQRRTTIGTETLNLHGIGNPLNNGTGLVRSAFRPSDDATILGFFIPANAMISVELKRTAGVIAAAGSNKELVEKLNRYSERIRDGIYKHAVVDHPRHGKVFAFEIDGYGSRILMDDANLPSLLSLPILGFVEQNDEIYQNTRKMILSQSGNPYYLTGSAFQGIGGPHIGLSNAWPMSVLTQARTSDSDEEIVKSINMVRDASRLGLIHESINVNRATDYTRSWFAWANSVFAQTILDIAEKRPHLIFGKGSAPYKVEDAKIIWELFRPDIEGEETDEENLDWDKEESHNEKSTYNRKQPDANPKKDPNPFQVSTYEIPSPLRSILIDCQGKEGPNPILKVVSFWSIDTGSIGAFYFKLKTSKKSSMLLRTLRRFQLHEFYQYAVRYSYHLGSRWHAGRRLRLAQEIKDQCPIQSITEIDKQLENYVMLGRGYDAWASALGHSGYLLALPTKFSEIQYTNRQYRKYIPEGSKKFREVGIKEVISSLDLEKLGHEISKRLQEACGHPKTYQNSGQQIEGYQSLLNQNQYLPTNISTTAIEQPYITQDQLCEPCLPASKHRRILSLNTHDKGSDYPLTPISNGQSSEEYAQSPPAIDRTIIPGQIAINPQPSFEQPRVLSLNEGGFITQYSHIGVQEEYTIPAGATSYFTNATAISKINPELYQSFKPVANNLNAREEIWQSSVPTSINNLLEYELMQVGVFDGQVESGLSFGGSSSFNFDLLSYY
ncbi:hypothetical protein FQN57_003751 [Myotisia sp. PD_48]|nr:hypothetical protein FQN57_003751 [Myotisia sp. PD_48]